MALINCYECGRQVSDFAKSCPGCGYAVKEKTDQLERKRRVEELQKQMERSDYIRNNYTQYGMCECGGRLSVAERYGYGVTTTKYTCDTCDFQVQYSQS